MLERRKEISWWRRKRKRRCSDFTCVRLADFLSVPEVVKGMKGEKEMEMNEGEREEIYEDRYGRACVLSAALTCGSLY